MEEIRKFLSEPEEHQDEFWESDALIWVDWRDFDESIIEYFNKKLWQQSPFELSGGQKRRVAIAGVLAMHPEVLILDEPTIAQDWKGRQIIGSIIRSLSGRGKLVIAILHDMDFVAENFERVIIMAHGQVLADGTAKEVFAQEEVLKKARLQKPYVMQLSEALGYEKSYLTVEELLKDRMSLCAAIKL